jgi:hypothetical protein
MSTMKAKASLYPASPGRKATSMISPKPSMNPPSTAPLMLPMPSEYGGYEALQSWEEAHVRVYLRKPEAPHDPAHRC